MSIASTVYRRCLGNTWGANAVHFSSHAQPARSSVFAEVNIWCTGFHGNGAILTWNTQKGSVGLEVPWAVKIIPFTKQVLCTTAQNAPTDQYVWNEQNRYLNKQINSSFLYWTNIWKTSTLLYKSFSWGILITIKALRYTHFFLMFGLNW